jgi:hypothetical protein
MRAEDQPIPAECLDVPVYRYGLRVGTARTVAFEEKPKSWRGAACAPARGFRSSSPWLNRNRPEPRPGTRRQRTWH